MCIKRFVLASLLLATPAFAQQAPDPIQDLNMDWQARQVADKHLLESINKVIAQVQALQQENAKLKADAEKAKEPPKEP